MRLGVIGDIHLCFDEVDVRQLDEESYDALLFVGDLAAYSVKGGLEIARRIASLSTPTYVMPGNHDAAHVGQMAAEVLEVDALIPLLNLGQEDREAELADALRPAILTGYSRHTLEVDGRVVEIVAGRPHSAGGPRLAFRPHLDARFGVEDLEDSVRTLTALVDESEADELIFFAHNGPHGLGGKRDDIWGCDFRKEEGDFGDLDLERAIEHARRRGKRVRAVVAGHMHHALRGGGHRRWQLERDGTLYLNAARVPRIFERAGRTLRHHVELRVDADRVHAREVLRST
ncbi:MAG: metallophosphoesterase [Myxococcota bacterium]|nr:metallophosphoesterase [Myxococcota bacterium]